MESRRREYEGPGENLRQYWEWQAEQRKDKSITAHAKTEDGQGPDIWYPGTSLFRRGPGF